MLLFPLILVLLALPLLWRVIRFGFRVHLWLVVLALPGGLLLRHGPAAGDMRVWIGVTAAWAMLLAVWRVHRWVKRRRTDAPRVGAAARTPPAAAAEVRGSRTRAAGPVLPPSLRLHRPRVQA